MSELVPQSPNRPMQILGQNALPDPLGAGQAGAQAGEVSPLQVAARWKWLILAFAVLVGFAAQIIVSGLPVRYDAESAVEIDTRELQVLNAEGVLSKENLDFERLRTEMVALSSPRLAEAVVRRLGLNKLPEYCAQDKGGGSGGMLLSALNRAAGKPASGTAPACEIPVEAAARKVEGAVSSFMDGRSYIIHISAQAGDPELAANIANAYAEGFIARRQDEKIATAQRVSTWLTTYLATLRTQMEAADAAVEQYRDRHRLTALRGETVTSQSLSDLNAQLSLVEAQLAEKQGELGQVGHGSAAVFDSPAVSALTAQEAELSASLSDLRSRLGEAHPQVVAMAARLAAVHRQTGSAMARSTTSLSSEVAALAAKRDSLTTQVRSLEGEVGAQGEANVGLQGLQRDADAQRQLYQTMLTRLKEIDAEQGIQRPDARLVVEAEPASLPSYPRKHMIVVGSFLAALGIGIGLAFAIELISPRFRNIEQIEQQTGLRVLGVFARPRRRAKPQNVAIDAPYSPEAESLQSVLASLGPPHLPHDAFDAPAGESAPRPPGRIVLVTSALPNEGKTSFAVALGRTAVRAGLGTILLDCDLRSPSVADAVLGLKKRQGATASGLPAIDGARNGNLHPVRLDERSGLHVLPIASYVESPHVLLTTPGLPALLQKLRGEYDLVLLDTPPVLAVPDAVNMARLADDVVLIMDRNATARAAMLAVVRIFRRAGIALAGIVLTKVPLGKSAQGAYGYYATNYGRYYGDMAVQGGKPSAARAGL